MYSFADTREVESKLKEISEEVDWPLWVQLPRAPGQKELRYQHLLSGEPAPVQPGEGSEDEGTVRADPVSSRDARVQQLEERVDTLEDELSQLKTAFEDFQKQFQ